MGILQARILVWLPCTPAEDLPIPGIEPRSPTLQADSLPTKAPVKPIKSLTDILYTYYYFWGLTISSVQFSSVQSLNHVCLFATPWIETLQASLSITNSRSSLRLMFIKSVMPARHLTLSRSLLLLPQSLPASESFPMSQLFTWGGQSTGVSALASFLSKKS